MAVMTMARVYQIGTTGCMRFGIDFGTTHTVVALIDRGNYPVVSFEQGDAIPSIVAADPEGELSLRAGRAGVGGAALLQAPAQRRAAGQRGERRVR